MPYIRISEQEETSLLSFDATENTVLIPMLYVRYYNVTGTSPNFVWTVDASKDMHTKKYTDYASFVKDYREMSGKIVTTTSGITCSGHRYIIVDGQIDASFVMAYECLLHGLNVVIKPIALEDSVVQSKWNDTARDVKLTYEEYHGMLEVAFTAGMLEEFKSRNIYNIKFLTSGAYPNIGKDTLTYVTKTVVANDAESFDPDTQIKLVDALKINPAVAVGDKIKVPVQTTNYCTMGAKMLEVSVKRDGDAIALLELNKKYESDSALLTELSNVPVDGDDCKYAAAFYPWISMSTSAVANNNLYTMPACFGYLMAYANSIRSNANWFAAAGVSRGAIPTMIEPVADVSEALMHVLQNDGTESVSGYSPRIAVNSIMNTGNYGVRLWGNRTANSVDGSNKYSNFLNVRVLVCDLKKQLYHASLKSTFEPNDDIAWFNFKSLTNTLLEKMKSGRGISWYKWKKESQSDLAVIKCSLEIKPIEAVESFDITIVLTDKDLSVSEG